MIKTKDEEINKILDKAEKYRKQYNKKINAEKNTVRNAKFKIIDNDIADIFEAFFGTQPIHNYKEEKDE